MEPEEEEKSEVPEEDPGFEGNARVLLGFTMTAF